MALTQRCVTNFVVLILRRICLTLEYAVLDVLIVSKDLGDSQRPGFVESICHDRLSRRAGLPLGGLRSTL